MGRSKVIFIEKRIRITLFIFTGLLVLCIFEYRQIDYFFNGEITAGKVVGFSNVYVPGSLNSHSRGISQVIPIIEYQDKDSTYRFEGTSNTNILFDQPVKIIFENTEHNEAMVYDFWGFWYKPMIYAFFPVMLSLGLLSAFTLPKK